MLQYRPAGAKLDRARDASAHAGVAEVRRGAEGQVAVTPKFYSWEPVRRLVTLAPALAGRLLGKLF